MKYTAHQIKHWLKYNIFNWEEILQFTNMSNDEVVKLLKQKNESFTEKITSTIRKKRTKKVD